MGSRAMRVLAAGLMCLALGVVPAQATFPGQNGKIAFFSAGDVWSINPDGTGEQNLTDSPSSANYFSWSPDGTRLVLGDTSEVWVMNADGSSRTNITNTPLGPSPNYAGYRELWPTWSPDGARIAYVRVFQDLENGDSPAEIVMVDADGTNPTTIDPTPVNVLKPKWHPDGTRLIFLGCSPPNSCPQQAYIINVDGTGESPIPTWGDFSPNGAKVTFDDTPSGSSYPFTDIFTQNLDGSGLVNVSAHPAVDRAPVWSPDGSKFAFWSGRGGAGPRIYVMHVDSSGVTQVTLRAAVDPQWQPLPVNSYPRPKGATPFQTYLVPAYEPCSSPNREHGPPLAFGSCNPPTSVSEVTVGTADANAKPTKSVSVVRLSTLAGNPATPADEADVRIEASITDVYDRATLADYDGDLAVSAPLQITDKLNTPHPGGPGAGTVTQAALGFPVSCAPTADTTVGATCALTTTFEALVPGAVPEGRRSIWELGQLEVRDSGGAPFMRQGVFVP